MKAFFKDKFEYNHWANAKIISIILAHPRAYTDRARQLISHTLMAQEIWNCRINEVEQPSTVWNVFDMTELEAINNAHHLVSLKIVETKTLNAELQYKNTKGVTYSNKIDNILYHIINHSTYHRGQLLSELKANGATPVGTDFIFFKR